MTITVITDEEIAVITDKEVASLKATTSELEWNDACDRIKAARNGCYPPDWWSKIQASGLMAQIAKTWKSDEFARY